MVMMDLREFKSLYRSWNPFHHPDFNSLFPQPVIPSESSSSDLIQFDPPPTCQDPSTGVQNPPPRECLIVEGSLILTNQSAVSGVTMTGVNKTRCTEYMRCDPCNIMCNSIVSWEAHLMGKKHIKKTQAFHGELIEISSTAFGEILETKRQKLHKGGAYHPSGPQRNA